MRNSFAASAALAGALALCAAAQAKRERRPEWFGITLREPATKLPRASAPPAR